METDEMLREVFKAAGKEHGFDRVEAEFTAFKEFKVRWQRSYKWAEFKVSDYMADAPEEVVKGLANSLFARIAGTDDAGYPKSLTDWITDPEFAELKQPLYLKRSRNLSRSPEGEKKSLAESLGRLMDMGLAEEDPLVHLSWTKESNIRKIGHCSVLMKVVSISSALDSDMIPDFVLDHCLHHELCHIMAGFDPSAGRHGESFAKLEERFPRKAEAEEWLRKLCMYL
ncbi:MAG: hypothetical protein LBS92_00200 [Candidatus Methanoplasma sp.]|nr:hypothetical protein [Candidatus Methanoplasma sp.]